MIFIKTTPISSEKETINLIHCMPELLSEAELATGYMLESVPEPTNIPPYTAPTAYYNPVTQEVFYEFVPRPKTPDEIMQEIVQQVSDLQIAMANIMGV